MTKAKTDSKTRGLDAEQTFINLAARIQSAQDSPDKQASLESAAAMVLEVVLVANWRPATMYRLGTAFLTSTDETARRGVISELVATFGAGIQELADQADWHALAVGLTQLLHRAGFTAREITELVDDGRGGSAQQQQDRAKSRFSGSPAPSLEKFWKTALVKGKDGAPNSR